MRTSAGCRRLERYSLILFVKYEETNDKFKGLSTLFSSASESRRTNATRSSCLQVKSDDMRIVVAAFECGTTVPFQPERRTESRGDGVEIGSSVC